MNLHVNSAEGVRPASAAAPHPLKLAAATGFVKLIVFMGVIRGGYRGLKPFPAPACAVENTSLWLVILREAQPSGGSGDNLGDTHPVVEATSPDSPGSLLSPEE
jgi:hypothetical protein